jgi:hypothetical protein
MPFARRTQRAALIFPLSVKPDKRVEPTWFPTQAGAKTAKTKDKGDDWDLNTCPKGLLCRPRFATFLTDPASKWGAKIEGSPLGTDTRSPDPATPLVKRRPTVRRLQRGESKWQSN